MGWEDKNEHQRLASPESVLVYDKKIFYELIVVASPWHLTQNRKVTLQTI